MGFYRFKYTKKAVIDRLFRIFFKVYQKLERITVSECDVAVKVVHRNELFIYFS